MRAIVTAIAIIAMTIILASADTIKSIEAEINHPLAESTRHQAEADYHKIEFSRYQVEFKRYSVEVKRIANEVEPPSLASRSKCSFATEGERHRYGNHLTKMDSHLFSSHSPL